MGRLVRIVVAGVVSALALSGLIRLYAPVSGAERQLAFIRAELDRGAGEAAQGMFPEGYFFLHALYGLAWVDVGRHHRRAEAVREARWALARLDGPQGTAPFSEGLSPRFGVFHAGWTNRLLGGIVGLDPDPALVERFEADARAIAAAFDGSASPFLPAYPGQSWPVDSAVAVASLRLHDELLTPAFGATVQRWVAAARQRLDPATGLLPHVTDPASGEPLQGARGSSQSVIQRFLPEIDQEFAREQYLRFRELFVGRPLGLGPAVREYPKGTDGPGDVDSGPLPLGVSLSATVVTIGAARAEGDDSLASALAHYGELAGVPMQTPGTKRYAFGLLPIGDAFLVWAQTAPARAEAPPAVAGPLWRVPLTVLLLLAGAGPWLRWRKPKRRQQLGE
ncbi:hypothetical protein [Dactylosporangium sp. CA-233914]|uniref:hypothetical protein n=1 Tax=Dactylosporangium sp. CA-233914 TaxID=3239934 RepID=UPI003D941185